MKNYYQILQISTDASEEVIKAAYKGLSRKYHPDSGEEKDADKFIDIQEAYEVLSDREKRKKYDEQIFNKNHSEEKIMEIVDKGEEEKTTEKTADKTEDKSLTLSDWIVSILFFGIIGFLIFGNAEKVRVQALDALGIATFSSGKATEDAIVNINYIVKTSKSKQPDVWLNIDGDRVATIEGGSGNNNIDLVLSPGQHIIFIESKPFKKNSEKYDFNVVEGNNNIFDYHIKSTWNGKKVDLYEGAD